MFGPAPGHLQLSIAIDKPYIPHLKSPLPRRVMRSKLVLCALFKGLLRMGFEVGFDGGLHGVTFLINEETRILSAIAWPMAARNCHHCDNQSTLKPFQVFLRTSNLIQLPPSPIVNQAHSECTTESARPFLPIPEHRERVDDDEGEYGILFLHEVPSSLLGQRLAVVVWVPLER